MYFVYTIKGHKFSLKENSEPSEEEIAFRWDVPKEFELECPHCHLNCIARMDNGEVEIEFELDYLNYCSEEAKLEELLA